MTNKYFQKKQIKKICITSLYKNFIFYNKKFFSTLLLVFICLNSGCKLQDQHITKNVKFNKTNFNKIFGWQYDHHLITLRTFSHSCKKIMQIPQCLPISNNTKLGGYAKQWQIICKNINFKQIKNDIQAKKFFEKWFVPYTITNKKKENEGIITGYYELSINGNLNKTYKYKHPIYSYPHNIKHKINTKDITHASINEGSLHNKKLEIIWVDNIARLHWMQIQGSGIVKLPNRKIIRLAYAGENKHNYTSVGPYFRKFNAKSIKSGLDMMKWIYKNPYKGKKLIEINKSYVFFKEIQGQGPVGKQGVYLKAERSIAIDNKIYPFGTPIWISTTLSNASNYIDRNYRRLFIAQDKGGAIKGSLRVDIFFGRGKRAEELACYMNSKGKLFALFPKGIKIPLQYDIN